MDKILQILWQKIQKVSLFAGFFPVFQKARVRRIAVRPTRLTGQKLCYWQGQDKTRHRYPRSIPIISLVFVLAIVSFLYPSPIYAEGLSFTSPLIWRL
ncbi:MAG: hypothetical protein KAJ18_11375, partial [Candidatus Omnitrophica bacterium]|nr:hypothetical protein [Candidatus Omnitrophota bacterium]